MLRRVKEFRLRSQEFTYETYENVHAVRFNAITQVCELEFSVNGTPAFIRIDNVHDVRFMKKAMVVGFIASGRGVDIELKPSKKVSVKMGTVFVG